jgi:hypothetical protein
VRHYLKVLYEILRTRNFRALRRLSDELINEYIVSKDENYLKLSLLAYVFSKIVGKNKYAGEEYKKDMERILGVMEQMYLKDDISLLSEVEKSVLSMESKDPRYIFDLFTKGRVKIAAILYAKGISLGEASRIMEVPKQEIQSRYHSK